MTTNYIKLIFSAALLIAASALSGCATLVTGLGDAIQHNVSANDSKVITASISWQGQTPKGYPRYKFHWDDAPKSVKDLRWTLASTTVGHGFSTIYLPLSVVVPSEVQELHNGDLIAVQNNIWKDTDYRTMNVPFVVRLICHAGDKECFNKFEASHDGKLYGVFLPEHYSMSQFTFTPRDQQVASAGDQQ